MWHVCLISSAVLGVLLGYVTQDASVCPSGYAAVHIVLWWLRVCIPPLLAWLVSVDTSAYRDSNHASVQLNYTSSAPRLSQTARPRYARLMHCALISMLGGACDALSLTIGPSSGDCHVLALGAVAVAPRRARPVVCALAAYVFWLQPLPSIHGIMRGLAIAVSVLGSLAILPPIWTVLRVMVTVLVTIGSSTASCSSKLGAVSPAMLLSVALFDLRLNPMVILTLAAIVRL